MFPSAFQQLMRLTEKTILATLTKRVKGKIHAGLTH
jgi:hypothetical protein